MTQPKRPGWRLGAGARRNLKRVVLLALLAGSYWYGTQHGAALTHTVYCIPHADEAGMLSLTFDCSRDYWSGE